MKVWTEGPLRLVEKDRPGPEREERERRLLMARNSYESYQIVVKAEENFLVEGVKFEGFEEQKELLFRYNYQETIAFAKEDFLDPLSNEPSVSVEGEQSQSIWITVYTGKTVKPGEYRGHVRVCTNIGTFDTELVLRIYRAVIPDTSEAAFDTEYWMNTVNFWFRYPSSTQLDFLNYYYGCEKYSEEWWKINQSIAVNMKESRVNVLFVRTHDLLFDGGSTLDAEGRYHFQWELFDKWIAFFEEYGGIKLFAGYHLVVQTEGQNIYLIDNVDGKSEITIAPIGSQKAENWFSQFLPALYTHLIEKGYKDRWLQHIEDEPRESDSWLYAAQKVRTYMPGIPLLDANDTQYPVSALQGNQDLWIPRVDLYERNREFYDYRLAQGDRRWVYCCCVPAEMNYTNRFLGWPLIHSRVLAWGCFVNHFSGFLHWGYNFWDPEDVWFGLNPKVYFKGDGYIVYPDPDNYSVKNSSRMIASRDGAQDYELLKLLADLDPKAAYEKAGKVIARFNDFDWIPETLEDARREILEELEGKWQEA